MAFNWRSAPFGSLYAEAYDADAQRSGGFRYQVKEVDVLKTTIKEWEQKMEATGDDQWQDKVDGMRSSGRS